MSPIDFPGEVYGVFIEFAIIQAPYTLDGYKLSKAGTLQAGPITTIGAEGGGGNSRFLATSTTQGLLKISDRHHNVKHSELTTAG